MGAVAYQGTEYANFILVPRSWNSTFDWGMTLQRFYFSAVSPTATYIGANADTIDVVPLLKNWRVWGGKVMTDDADATISVGTDISGQSARYGSALACFGDTPKDFGNTIALKLGEQLAADCALRLTIGTAVLGATQLVRGFIDISTP